jgi:hypothetical protein
LQSSGQKSAMISSTAIDLPEHRKQVLEACLCQEIFPIGMESLPARDADAIQVSMEMVNGADIYIGILAWRYGHIPKGHNVSITEMEFNRAVERRIPILMFIIHPDHPITIGMVEANSNAQSKIKKLKHLACKGRGRCQFKSSIELRGQVIHALSALKQREFENRSPAEAIRAEQERLEKLDPKAIVKLAADSHSMKYEIKIPKTELKFPDSVGQETLKAFFEKGQSFEINAKDFQTDISPIINEFLDKVGDTKITIKSASTFNGCVQFLFKSSNNELIQIQIDGAWSIAPKHVSFYGQLADSPLQVKYVREAADDGKPELCVITCGLDFNAWKDQPLLSLAYFSELYEFMQKFTFKVRSLVRGHQFWPPESLNIPDEGRKRAIEALDWLHRTRRAAKYLKINPGFPQADTINANESESKDFHLMIRLIESGFYQQSNVGEEVGISGETTDLEPEIGERNLTVNLPESFLKINFYGFTIPFGPLLHIYTDVELVEKHPLGGKRVEMIFRGSAKSTWRIEYKRTS